MKKIKTDGDEKVAAPAPQDGDERAYPFALLCEMLPESTSWGDALTPDIARHIAQAALASNKAAAIAISTERARFEVQFKSNHVWNEAIVEQAWQEHVAAKAAAVAVGPTHG